MINDSHIYLRGRKVETRNGKMYLFWLDPWQCEEPLCLKFPVLFDLCENKNMSVYQFLLKMAN
jgi:hypothetical protein